MSHRDSPCQCTHVLHYNQLFVTVNQQRAAGYHSMAASCCLLGWKCSRFCSHADGHLVDLSSSVGSKKSDMQTICNVPTYAVDSAARLGNKHAANGSTHHHAVQINAHHHLRGGCCCCCCCRHPYLHCCCCPAEATEGWLQLQSFKIPGYLPQSWHTAAIAVAGPDQNALLLQGQQMPQEVVSRSMCLLLTPGVDDAF